MKRTICLAIGLLVTALASAAPDWDRAAAAKYLDDRMTTWFEKGKKLRTADSQTTCVSCHTALPYMLARPALRRSMNVATPTSHETRTIDDVVRRVGTYGSHQLLYENNDAKKAESRGTEAIVNALVLASAGHPAVTKAMARLWETQRADGAWDWLNFGLEPFETTDGLYQGATLAALAVGLAVRGGSLAAFDGRCIPAGCVAPRSNTPGILARRALPAGRLARLGATPDFHHGLLAPQATNGEAAAAEAGVAKLQQFLKTGYASQRLYNQLWVLLASTKLSGLLTAAERDAVIAEIERRQRSDGGWSLESLGAWRWSRNEGPFAAPGQTDSSLLGQSDGYATGLIVYTLRQARLASDRPSVSKGLQWLRSNQRGVEIEQQSWTAWRAHSLNFDREHGGEKGESWRRLFMSDLATAFAVLALTASE